MLDVTIYNPRDVQFKVPYGAVPCGTKVQFTLRPPVWESFVGGSLAAFCEFLGKEEIVPLIKSGTEGDRALFTAAYTAPMEGELVWYSFRFTRQDGTTVYVGKNGFSKELSETQSWQMTVYDDTTTKPTWFGEGITYQIFPDRFCRSRIPDPAGMVGNRKVHQDWEELMDYLPENGEILNRDFYGGDLQGVISKLDYLQSLGVKTLYFCPIFEADSNHRYNTADYSKIDPMLGDEKDFRELCRAAHDRGMKILLDGVFNHTGDNSLYFNAKGFYPTLGAAQSQDSPYYGWYNFYPWPTTYDSWWGIHTLPAVNELHPLYVSYIIEGDNSIIRKWLRLGADGWRLDVADELPDEFIYRIRKVMEEENEDAFLLGEVWEDGSNKIAYSKRRKYLLGHETHGLMNYPFRTAAMDYVKGGSARSFVDAMETIRENYPPHAFYSAMNMLGTHDNPRILTMLGAMPQEPLETRTQRAYYKLSPQERQRGRERLMVGATLLYTFPGSPTVYYGDEIGMEGFEDPFNRGTFPWGKEDAILLAHFKKLGQLRNSRVSLQKGDISYFFVLGGGLGYRRSYGEETTYILLNTGSEAVTIPIPWEDGTIATDAITRQQFKSRFGTLTVVVPPCDGLVLV